VLSLTAFIQSFISRKGLFVMLSVFLAKLVNFIVTILVIRILSKGEYGLIAYGLTIISFVAPFAGAGMFQGLLRFGALSNGQIDKKVLFDITFRKGLRYSALMVVLLIIISPVLTINLPEALLYLLLLSFQILGLFIFLMIQVYCRLIYQNKLFAFIDIQNNLLLLVFNVGMCYFFGGMGYVLSVIIIPLFVGLYYLKKLKLYPIDLPKNRIAKIKASFNFDSKELFYYGLYMSTGGLLSQLLFAIDILLIGNLLSDAELVAQYKASSIIPFSILIIASAVMMTDFVKLASTSKNNKPALQQYYWNYLKIFSLISIGIILFFYFFSAPLLSIFGAEYQGHPRLMFIFAIGVVGGILFRVPMGNMLSAIGWPKINALFSVLVLVINLIANYFMIRWYGIEGAAITTSALMWLSGLLSLGAFVYYLKRGK
jgi:O-antigen/teichoic acid export membrane protein